MREFVPLQLSGKYRFITLTELKQLSKHKGSVGSLMGHRERGNEIGTVNMCGPLIMRAIEYCWILDLKNENSGQIKPMRIIDYIKKCGINGEGYVIEGYSKRLDFAHHFAANDWIGWIKFDNEHMNNDSYLLTNKHGYSVLHVHKNNLTVANPRYYDQGDKRTIINVDYETEGLSGFFYILYRSF